ncbi:MAG: HIT family protein [Motilibacteraceae bacterium]
MTGCPFCAIVDGSSPAQVVLDEPGFVGFLDVRPVFPGHVLVVPREHVEVLADLPAPQLGPLLDAVRRVGLAVEKGIGAQGTFVAVNQKVSQSVPHLHVHVVPRTKGDGLRGFFWPRHRYPADGTPGDAASTADALRAALPPPASLT